MILRALACVVLLLLSISQSMTSTAGPRSAHGSSRVLQQLLGLKLEAQSQ
jgi:hypothetical protein